jgi:hypothetical protein
MLLPPPSGTADLPAWILRLEVGDASDAGAAAAATAAADRCHVRVWPHSQHRYASVDGFQWLLAADVFGPDCIRPADPVINGWLI